MNNQNSTYSSKVFHPSLEEEREIYTKRYEEARDQWILTRFSGDLNRVAECMSLLNYTDRQILEREYRERKKCSVYKFPSGVS